MSYHYSFRKGPRTEAMLGGLSPISPSAALSNKLGVVCLSVRGGEPSTKALAFIGTCELGRRHMHPC